MDYYTLRGAARKRRRRQRWRRRVRYSSSESQSDRACGEARHQGVFRRLAGRGAIEIKSFKRWQRAAFERSGEGGAAGVGDLGEAGVERLD